MNIFIYDYDIITCSVYHPDKHCVKMPTEYAQILCNAFPLGYPPYKRTHYNHPACIFARQTEDNYRYLIELGIRVSEEYTFRYERRHKSQDVIEWCERNLHMLEFSESGLTPFALAMPDEYKTDDVVDSYRNFFNGDKLHIAKWKKRELPHWINLDALHKRQSLNHT